MTLYYDSVCSSVNTRISFQWWLLIKCCLVQAILAADITFWHSNEVFSYLHTSITSRLYLWHLAPLRCLACAALIACSLTASSYQCVTCDSHGMNSRECPRDMAFKMHWCLTKVCIIMMASHKTSHGVLHYSMRSLGYFVTHEWEPLMMAAWRSIGGAQGGTLCQLLQRACCTCKKVLLTTTSWHIVRQSFRLELRAMHKQLLTLTTCKTTLSYTYETLYQVTHTGCTSSTAVSTSQHCRKFLDITTQPTMAYAPLINRKSSC